MMVFFLGWLVSFPFPGLVVGCSFFFFTRLLAQRKRKRRKDASRAASRSLWLWVLAPPEVVTRRRAAVFGSCLSGRFSSRGCWRREKERDAKTRVARRPVPSGSGFSLLPKSLRGGARRSLVRVSLGASLPSVSLGR